MILRLIKLRGSLAAGFLGAALCFNFVQAQQVPDSNRYDLRPWPDAAVFGASATSALLRHGLDSRLPLISCAPCDRSRLWGIDRGAVGTFDAGASRTSDVLLMGTAWGAATALLLSRGRAEWSARLEDLAVLAEALSVNDAATTWTKVLFHRARPDHYVASPIAPPGRSYSFPSGHTSGAFAAAAAYASILHRRGLAGRHRLEIAALFAGAAATGAMRVAAHKHFPTDVVAGAVLGTAIGWSLPAIHR